MKKPIAIICSFFCSVVYAQDIKIEVDDCGPLARGELVVVFSTKPHGAGQSYFAKGPLAEVCTKLTEAKYVIGYEEPYCENHKPFDPRECEHRKVFVIKEYVLN